MTATMILGILGVVAPVFCIIGAGWLASRAGKFNDQSADALLGFVVRFAAPALLFKSMYTLDLGRAFEPGMLISFYVGAITCFFLGVLLAKAFGRRPGEQVAIGFCGFFSNTLLLGLPIMERAYGAGALEPMFGVIALHAPFLYTFGMVSMEVARRDGAGAAAAAKRAARNIASNGLTVGILLGLALNLAHIQLPQAAADAVAMFTDAALPAALFGIGAALTRYRLRSDLALAAGVATISLMVHPAIAWTLSTQVFALPEPFVRAAVVTAAMPSGMNVYIFAAMYRRAEGAAASILLIATAASILTISAWLALLGGVAGG